jgi:hypothetical protein
MNTSLDQIKHDPKEKMTIQKEKRKEDSPNQATRHGALSGECFLFAQ